MTLLAKLVGDDKNCTCIYRFLANSGMSRGGVRRPPRSWSRRSGRVPALPYPLVGLSAPGLGDAALETLVLLGDGLRLKPLVKAARVIHGTWTTS